MPHFSHIPNGKHTNFQPLSSCQSSCAERLGGLLGVKDELFCPGVHCFKHLIIITADHCLPLHYLLLLSIHGGQKKLYYPVYFIVTKNKITLSLFFFIYKKSRHGCGRWPLQIHLNSRCTHTQQKMGDVNDNVTVFFLES